MFTSKNKIFFVGLAIVTLVPMAALAATAAAAPLVPVPAGPALTPPAPPVLKIFEEKIGFNDWKSQVVTQGAKCQRAIDPNDKNARALIAPVLNNVGPCPIHAIKEFKAALEGIKDNDTYQAAKADVDQACPAGSAPKLSIVDIIVENYKVSATAPLTPVGIALTAKIVDGKTETRLNLVSRDTRNPLLDRQSLPYIPDGDSSCSSVDKLIGKIDIDGITNQIVTALNAKAAACKQKKDAATESSEVLNDISQLHNDGSADIQSDALSLPVAGQAI